MTVNTTYDKNYLTMTATIQKKIENLIEYCKNIKQTIKKENKFRLYEDIDNDLGEISKILRKNEEIFFNELKSFVQIRSLILYIAGQNCKNQKFGHFDSIRYLLNIFKEIIMSKFQYLNNRKTHQNHESEINSFNEKLSDFTNYFNENILIVDSKYDKLINDLDIALRCVE